MKRLLLIGHEATRTGAPMILLTIVRELSARGVRCEVVLLRGGPLVQDFAAVAPTTVLRTMRVNWPQTIATQSVIQIVFRFLRLIHTAIGSIIMRIRIGRTFRRLQRMEFDCIYVHSAASASLITWISSLHRPIVSSIYELALGLSLSAHPLHIRQLLEKSHRIIVPCRALHTQLTVSHGVPAQKVVVLPEPVPDPLPLVMHSDPATVRTELGISHDAFVVAMAGTIDWRKGIDLFIGLGRILASSIPGSRFLWIGGGPSEQLFRATWKQWYGVDAALAEHFIFTGERTDVARLLTTANVFALTSREDPSPLVHIEAAMLQKPIVCFEGTGGAPEWIADGGVVVPYQDICRMAQGIAELTTDPSRAKTMGNAGRSFMIETCNPSKIVGQLLEIIDVAVL